MEKTKKITEVYNELKNIKMGLLKLSYAAAAHGQTIRNAGRDYTVPEFCRELAANADDLHRELNTRVVLIDVLANKNRQGDTFTMQRLRLETLKQGLLEISSTVESDKAIICKGDKHYTIFQYERKLISDIESIERELKNDASTIGTALDKKFKPNTVIGMATGPLTEAN